MMHLFFLTLATALQLISQRPFLNQDLSWNPAYGPPPTWSCTQEHWVTPPVLVNGVFTGEIAGNCEVRGTVGQGLVSLNANLLETATQVERVHEGPVAETYQGLPGFRYDVTTKHVGEGETLLVRSDIHIVTDLRSLLVYDTLSTKIEATGFASYLKKVDFGLDVSPIGDAFQVRMRSKIMVDKPWYAPEGLFKSKATELTVQQFKKGRDDLMPFLAKYL